MKDTMYMNIWKLKDAETRDRGIFLTYAQQIRGGEIRTYKVENTTYAEAQNSSNGSILRYSMAVRDGLIRPYNKATQ